MAIKAKHISWKKRKTEWMKDRLLWLNESLILRAVLLGQGYKNILYMLDLKKKARGTNENYTLIQMNYTNDIPNTAISMHII